MENDAKVATMLDVHTHAVFGDGVMVELTLAIVEHVVGGRSGVVATQASVDVSVGVEQCGQAMNVEGGVSWDGGDSGARGPTGWGSMTAGLGGAVAIDDGLG